MKCLKITIVVTLLFTATIALLNSCKESQAASANNELSADSLRAIVDNLTRGRVELGKNLNVFDTLDFVVYSKQQWDRLHESHSKDIIVHYPDGSTTIGLEDHVKILKPLFQFAPDTHIDIHPIRFGTEDAQWTCVTGTTEGTFSQAMDLGNGNTMPPTGKSFKMNMATIGKWKAGVMVEEWLFWDNHTMMKQIGLAQ